MIFQSQLPKVTIPNESFTEHVLGGADRYGEKPALIDALSGECITYAGLSRDVRAIAAGLKARGFKRGDVLAIQSPNLPAYATLFHAVIMAGGMVTTVNPLNNAEDLGKQLRDSGARFLVTVAAFLEVARAAQGASAVEEIFVFGEADGASSVASLHGDPAEAPTLTVDPATDVVALPYSSGTTGFSKGVMLTHRNLVANLTQIEPWVQMKSEDVVLGILPFFHIYGMVVVMNAALKAGATIVCAPKFDLAECLGMIQQHKITRGYVVPPIMLALAKLPLVDEYDLSSLKEVLSGAAPLSPEISQAVAGRLHCKVKQGYGLTETSPVTHLSPMDEEDIVFGSAGRLIPNTECKVVDIDSGEALGTGARGELWMRGPQVMKGYLNNPDATAHAIDADGWFHSGDIGYVDDAGNFFIVDRLKELIKYKGFQVAPAELEALLLTHPKIADAAVIPSPDEEAGEVPKAFVVTKERLEAEEIIAFVGAKVSPHKKVRKVELVDAIPKSASGKILRRLLVERECGGEHPA